MYTSTWTPDPADVKMSLQSVMTDEKIWDNCKVNYIGELLSTIANGDKNSVPITLNWNGTLNFSLNWNYSAGTPSCGYEQFFSCQSTEQNSTNAKSGNKSMSVTLAPNTNTDLSYQAQHYVDSYAEYGAKNANGSSLATQAWLNSLEIVPKQ